MGSDGFGLFDQADLNFLSGLLRQIHQVYGTGQIRRTTTDKEYVKLQCFSGFFHVIFLY
jgi:hypothetical protein